MNSNTCKRLKPMYYLKSISMVILYIIYLAAAVAWLQYTKGLAMFTLFGCKNVYCLLATKRQLLLTDMPARVSIEFKENGMGTESRDGNY